MTMVILAIFIISAIGIILAATNPEYDWAPGLCTSCTVVAFICALILSVKEDEKPIRIHAKQQPQIDTIIEIRNRIPDTTYVYSFYKED